MVDSEKLPFSRRIRIRRVKTQPEQKVDVNDIGIDPRFLRSVMIKESRKHKMYAATNLMCAYDKTLSISNDEALQNFASFEDSSNKERINLRTFAKDEADSIESTGKWRDAKIKNVRGTGNNITSSL